MSQAPRAEAPIAAETPPSFDEAVTHLVATEPKFATGTVELHGVTYKSFLNAPSTLGQMLRDSRPLHDDGAADYLVYDEDRWTYDEYLAEIDRMARVLREEFGFGPGDRIAMATRNYPEFTIMIMAAASIGAVTVFLNAWWTTEEFDFALGDSEARLVLADGPRLERILPLVEKRGLTTLGIRDGEAKADHAYSALRDKPASDAALPPIDIEADADFAVMYSSGTTGSPKGVVQTHRGAITAVWTWLFQLPLAALTNPPGPDAPPVLRSSALIVTPLFHVTATHPMFLLSMPAGAKVTLLHKWDAEEAIRLIEREQVTRFIGVPTQCADLMETARARGKTLPSLRYMGSGGAKRPATQVGALAETFPTAGVATGWGMTETNALGIGMAGDEYVARPGSAGRLYPPVQEIMIADENGQPVPNGTMGEIRVKSLANMRCYLNRPEQTAEVLKDGWLSTGDLGTIDDEGFVTILDRKKNIIIRGGENIACLDVEGGLHRHPDVLEACAFSVPDDRLGEVVGALLHLRPGAPKPSLAELSDFLRPHMAHFKIPVRVWHTYDPLPRGATDKTDRRTVRATCLNLSDTAAAHNMEEIA